MKEKFAKGIRSITAPPVLITVFILVLAEKSDGTILNGLQCGISIICLGIIPILAYPMQRCMPKYKNEGRKGQRKLAFIFTLTGYVLAWFYGVISKTNEEVMLVYTTFLLAAFLLSLCNAVIKVRASGHMCSVAAPMMLLIYFLGWKAAIPCLLVVCMVSWSSISLKRHSVQELAAGMCIGIVGFLIAAFLI